MYLKGHYRCFEDPGWSTANSKGLDTWNCVTPVQSNELWVYDGSAFVGARGHIVVLIKNVYSGKCINDPGYSTANGTQLVQYTCNRSNSNSQWYEQKVPGKPGVVLLHNEYSGKCIDIAGNSISNGAKLTQWTCSTSYLNQQVYIGA